MFNHQNKLENELNDLQQLNVQQEKTESAEEYVIRHNYFKTNTCKTKIVRMCIYKLMGLYENEEKYRRIYQVINNSFLWWGMGKEEYQLGKGESCPEKETVFTDGTLRKCVSKKTKHSALNKSPEIRRMQITTNGQDAPNVGHTDTEKPRVQNPNRVRRISMQFCGSLGWESESKQGEQGFLVVCRVERGIDQISKYIMYNRSDISHCW